MLKFIFLAKKSERNCIRQLAKEKPTTTIPNKNGPRNNQNIGPANYMFCVSKKKKPNEQYSFEAETSHFSAYINFEILHMKKLPNSLKCLQENDEIQEKVAKDIS